MPSSLPKLRPAQARNALVRPNSTSGRILPRGTKFGHPDRARAAQALLPYDANKPSPPCREVPSTFDGHLSPRSLAVAGHHVHNKRLDGQGGQRAIASDETQTPDRCTHLAYITALSLRALFQCSGAAAGDDCGSRTVSVERCESSNRTLGFSDLVQMD